MMPQDVVLWLGWLPGVVVGYVVGATRESVKARKDLKRLESRIDTLEALAAEIPEPGGPIVAPDTAAGDLTLQKAVCETHSLLIQAQQETITTLTASRQKYREAAAMLHDAEVGAGTAGAFNAALCEKGIWLFDEAEAEQGYGFTEDVVEILSFKTKAEQAEARLRALRETMKARADAWEGQRTTSQGAIYALGLDDQAQICASELRTILGLAAEERPR